MNIAISTCAILREPYGTPRSDSFEIMTAEVFSAADSQPGLISRADYHDDRVDLTEFERDWGPWGEFALPKFCASEVTEPYRAAQSLTVWKDLESVREFTYKGLHQSALRKRRDWFLRTPWPTYCLWWVKPEHHVTWSEAADRLDHLNDYGDTPSSFSFIFPYGPDGEMLPGL